MIRLSEMELFGQHGAEWVCWNFPDCNWVEVREYEYGWFTIDAHRDFYV